MAGASGTADPAALEQHFVLRVPNPELADKLRGWLRNTEQLNEHISLIFEAPSPCIGELLVDGERHQVVLQDLPTVVESYKTLDDANLVKIADIGQVLLVVDPSAPPHPPSTDGGLSYAATDGVTPPMRKAAARHFKPPIRLPHELMADAAADVVELLAGRAPDGYTFTDVEEVYSVDPLTGEGTWVAARAAPRPRSGGAAEGGGTAAGAAPSGGSGGPGSGAGGRGRRGAPKGKRGKSAAGGSEDDDDFMMSGSD